MDNLTFEFNMKPTTKPQKVKSQTLDRKFDQGGSIVGHLNLTSARRLNTSARRVNVDFPTWMVESLDREAERVGVTRQSLIKLWLAERLGEASCPKL
jgi:hypothetical protein